MTPPAPRSPVRRAFLIVAALLALAMTSACASDDPGETAGGTPAIVVADAPSLPDTVDALPAVDADGFESIVEDVRGTPLVVNFWASWCDPCERELPLLVDAAERYRDTVQFLGVDILDTPDPARAFLRRFGVPYPNVADPSGAARDGVGSLGQPVTVFYAADGEVVAKVDGELGPDELARHLDTLAG